MLLNRINLIVTWIRLLIRCSALRHERFDDDERCSLLAVHAGLSVLKMKFLSYSKCKKNKHNEKYLPIANKTSFKTFVKFFFVAFFC